MGELEARAVQAARLLSFRPTLAGRPEGQWKIRSVGIREAKTAAEMAGWISSN